METSITQSSFSVQGTPQQVKDYMKRLEIAFGSNALMQDVLNSLNKPRILAGYGNEFGTSREFTISITTPVQNISPSITSQIFKAGYEHQNLFVPMKVGAIFSKSR